MHLDLPSGGRILPEAPEPVPRLHDAGQVVPRHYHLKDEGLHPGHEPVHLDSLFRLQPRGQQEVNQRPQPGRGLLLLPSFKNLQCGYQL